MYVDDRKYKLGAKRNEFRCGIRSAAQSPYCAIVRLYLQ